MFSYILFCKLNCTFQEDESLRRWKEKLLGCLEEDLNGLSQVLNPYSQLHFPFRISQCWILFHEVVFPFSIGQTDPEVRFHSIAVVSEITHIMQAILGVPKIREATILEIHGCWK